MELVDALCNVNSISRCYSCRLQQSLLQLVMEVVLERTPSPAGGETLLTGGRKISDKLRGLVNGGHWITVTGNLYNVSLKLTSATVLAASTNSIPVIPFCLALLLRMEELKLRNPSGIAKLTGVALCLAGILVIALYAGELLSPVNHHRAFAAPTHGHASATAAKTLMGAAWIKGTFVAGFLVSGLNYYLQAWCIEMKGPVFQTAWTPLTFILTIFCSSFFLGEMVHLGSVIGGILLCGGLYSVLWGKSRETKTVQCNIEATMVDAGAQDEVHRRELEG
ncbi:unnamed protein product [Miscanthus lutarioriparius]|uniref:WAT1-related protein n=1 Tax=Miscanthus lutarioriparius TaxID=422564 RepID=A0A811QWW3_9POAL|nr:unnamed protein product [Miscanthus lutarioriparius]